MLYTPYTILSSDMYPFGTGYVYMCSVTADNRSPKGDEPVGGMASALNGKKPGERFILAVPPAVSMMGNMDDRQRVRPNAWLLVVMEVHRPEAAAGPAPSITAPAAPVSPTATSSSSNDDPNSLKNRMAKLSQQASGRPAPIPVAGSINQAMAGSNNAAAGASPAPNTYTAPATREPVNSTSQAPVSHQQPHHHSQHHDHENNNAIAIIPGQEARSFYGSEAPAEFRGSRSSNSQQMDVFSSQSIIMLQQSLSSVQTSVIQLHGKMDSLLAVSGGGAGGGNSQLMQMQQQMMMLQQQIVRSGSGPGFNTAADNPLKPKGEEIVAILQSMMEEYDRKKSAGGVSDAANEKLAKLEEKLEALQVFFSYEYVNKLFPYSENSYVALSFPPPVPTFCLSMHTYLFTYFTPHYSCHIGFLLVRRILAILHRNYSCATRSSCRRSRTC
jgi:hypothetical protein